MSSPAKGENMAMPMVEKSLSRPNSPPYFCIKVRAMGSSMLTPPESITVPTKRRKK